MIMSKKSAKSRAEIVRERCKESKRSSRRARRRGRRKSTSKLPPVLVRGTNLAADADPPSQRKRKRVKRRYDVALPTPGVEMRLPSLPVIKIGWRVLSFLMLVGLSLLLYFLWTSPTFQVGNAEVHGAKLLPADGIDNALLIHGRPIFVVKPDALERQLSRTFPGLKQVSARVGFPARVVVTVEERVPVLAWQQGERLLWVDAQGIAFPPRGEVDSLPRVSASVPPPAPPQPEAESPQEAESSGQVYMSTELITPVIKLSTHLPEGTVVKYDRQHGFGWQDPAGWQVYFGTDIADVEAKIRLYEDVVEKVKAEGVQPVLISVEYAKAPYYRLEQ